MKVLQNLAISLPLITLSLVSFGQDAPKRIQNKAQKWFPKYDFEPVVFQKPPLEFGPFARWWWPGNDVDPKELKREINVFANNDFGGVEIQPLNLFIPGTKEARAKAMTWDSPDYYDNVKTVMEEAKKRGITIDMTDGSGWPPGGSFLSPNDGFLNLLFTSLDIIGDKKISVALPTVKNTDAGLSRLEAVLAVKALPKNADDKTKTVLLDPTSTIILTGYVKNDSLHWVAPAGNWKIIALWSTPGTQMTMTATTVQGPVVNHLDSTKIIKQYKHLFGERTGLQPYFGNPMRAVFNDSYEFAVDRFYSPNFINYFKKHRGYDITPWLPAEMQRGYDYVNYLRPKADLDFSFSDQDWRLRYDYDLTISELFGEQFIKASTDWLEPQGLLHRTQAYGFNMDMIAQAGLASIPETETMLGPEANLKIMTSGGHLYNRPIESAESIVYINRAYTTTPQKIKIAVDKLFAAGVNQVIYHGVPYRYTPSELGPEGWYPFSTPLFSGVNFSSNLGEGNIFWKDQKTVNTYINRTQYALRAGKARADVLIYFPFMDVDGMPDNPEEIMANGYLKGVEGPLPFGKEGPVTAKEKWAKKVYPIINQLEAIGVTWDWVNDPSIQAAQLTVNKQINIRGNIYQALILADDSIIQLKTAQKIRMLTTEGMKFIATGTLPHMQPSFLNWKNNDIETKNSIVGALNAKGGRYIKNKADLDIWIKGLDRPVLFNGQYHFTRQVQRDMSDGSRIQFIWNKSDQWQTLSLTLSKKYKSSYWMNADEGTMVKNNNSVVSYRMPPYGATILYASTKMIAREHAKKSLPILTDQAKEVISLRQWDLKIDSVELKKIPLFDWRTSAQLKFSSSEGIYSSTFQWKKVNPYAHFYLDLGKVYFTAEVYINGKFAGERVFSPYMLDITPFLLQGENKIEIHVTTGQLNGFIGKAKQGDNHYKQFKNKEDQLMAAGLVGPVLIRKEDQRGQ